MTELTIQTAAGCWYPLESIISTTAEDALRTRIAELEDALADERQWVAAWKGTAAQFERELNALKWGIVKEPKP